MFCTQALYEEQGGMRIIGPRRAQPGISIFGHTWCCAHSDCHTHVHVHVLLYVYALYMYIHVSMAWVNSLWQFGKSGTAAEMNGK